MASAGRFRGFTRASSASIVSAVYPVPTLAAYRSFRVVIPVTDYKEGQRCSRSPLPFE